MSVLLGGSSLGGDETLALLSGELLGVTGRRIGLDTLRVERGFDTDLIRQDPGLVAEDLDPGTRLTMSKRIRSNVEVILSQDLRQNGGLSAIINYRPIRNVELRAILARQLRSRLQHPARAQLRRRGAGGDRPARERRRLGGPRSRAPAPTKPRCAAASA